MNFFEHQDRARRSTFWLIVLFALAVVAIITSVNVAVFAIVTIVGDRAGHQRRGPTDDYRVDAPAAPLPAVELVAAVTGATIVVIAGGSLYKIAMLSRGGHAVARMLR